jgi:signal recognition particle subunit SRP54
MFSQLGDKLQDIFKDLRGHGSIIDANLADTMSQVRLAFFEADVDTWSNFALRIKQKRSARRCCAV